MYADDLVLFVPSSAGLAKLIRICEKVGITHDIKYNSKKSAVIYDHTIQVAKRHYSS